MNSTRRGSAQNAYHSDLNSVTPDNFTNSWGSIKAHLKYATCHFYIRRHAVQNGTLSLVFVIILQAKLVSSWGLKCQMIYPLSPPPLTLRPPPPSRAGWRRGVRFTFKFKPGEAVDERGRRMHCLCLSQISCAHHGL